MISMNKKYIILLLFVVFISINVCFASDNNQSVIDVSNQVNISDEEYNLIQSPKNDEINDVGDIIAIEENSKDLIGEDNDSLVIYVGQNSSSDGGNGTYENPYSTLKLACDNVNGEETTIINIFNGTYLVGSELKFDTNNLIINGLGKVINSLSSYLNIFAISGFTKVYVLASFKPKLLSLLDTILRYLTSPTYSPRLTGILGRDEDKLLYP